MKVFLIALDPQMEDVQTTHLQNELQRLVRQFSGRYVEEANGEIATAAAELHGMILFRELCGMAESISPGGALMVSVNV